MTASNYHDASAEPNLTPILDLVFWCRYVSGEPRAMDPDEVAGLEWLSAEEIRADARTMPWTVTSLDLVERARASAGWPG